MNLAQSLAAAAAALMMGLSAGGVAPAQTMSQIAAAAHERLQPFAIRGAVEELAALLEERYVFPDVAQQYAAHLRTRAEAGAYDGVTDPQQLAAQLTGELNSIHRDAHLRVTLSGGSEPGRRVLRAPPGDEAFGQAQWLAGDVAYLRIDMLPGDEDSQQRMAAILDQYAEANVLILDLRTCRGGTLGVMDVLLSRLYSQPTQLVTMDTRAGADNELEDFYGATATMREIADAPRHVRRWQHWAMPVSPVSSLADARVFVLTDATASACEHLSLALKETGRATLIGATTRGAGHYGMDRPFAGGRLQAFVPVGRTYIERTGQGWEGVGIAPDRAVAPREALNEALRELNVAPTAVSAALSAIELPREVVRVDNAASPTRRYGLGMAGRAESTDSIEVLEVMEGFAAARSGLQRGDRILSVNGRAVRDIPEDEFGQLMRSSPLTLVVDRSGERLTLRMSIDG
ncbi:MAG: S41 family peptidase [Hyphomonadaceae bacterium]